MRKIDPKTKRLITAFMSKDPDWLDAENQALGEPVDNAFESSSSDTVEIFKKPTGIIDHVAAYLKDQADRINSKILSALLVS